MMTSFTSPKLNVGIKGGANSNLGKFSLHIAFILKIT